MDVWDIFGFLIFFFLVVISLKLTCYLQRASPVAHLVKNLPAKAGDARDIGLILESGKSPGEGNGNPLQYYHLENSMDRGAWWTIDHGVTKSRTQLSAHKLNFTLLVELIYLMIIVHLVLLVQWSLKSCFLWALTRSHGKEHHPLYIQSGTGTETKTEMYREWSNFS